MQEHRVRRTGAPPVVVLATDEAPVFRTGDTVQVLPACAHRTLPGPTTTSAAARVCWNSVVTPRELDNEEEGYGRNAGRKRHYYRVSFAMRDVWPGYPGPARDRLLIEVFETWLKGMDP